MAGRILIVLLLFTTWVYPDTLGYGTSAGNAQNTDTYLRATELGESPADAAGAIVNSVEAYNYFWIDTFSILWAVIEADTTSSTDNYPTLRGPYQTNPYVNTSDMGSFTWVPVPCALM